MDLDAFLWQLAKVAPLYRWELGWDGQIVGRRSEIPPTMCPLTAVATAMGARAYGCGQYAEAGGALGLGWDIIDQVVCAADSRAVCHRHIRRRLLAAVGLSECTAVQEVPRE